MIDINNKEARKVLMERYLEADTTVSEETALMEYYSTHAADADEQAFAQLILQCHTGAANLSADEEQEYDRIMEGGTTKSLTSRLTRRTISLAAAAAAAAVLVFVLWLAGPEDEETFCVSPTIVAESIDAIINMDYDNIESVTAKPNGSTVIIVAKKKDGSSSTYLMTHNEEEGTTTFFAWDN